MVKVFADQSTLQAECGDAPRGEEEGPGDQLELDDPGDEENRRLKNDQQGPQQSEEAQQAQAADDLRARDDEVQEGIFDDEIEEPPQQERRRIAITNTKRGLSLYPHLEINAVLIEVDEGRQALGIEEPAPPEQAKRWRLYGKGPEVRPHHPRIFKIDATGGD